VDTGYKNVTVEHDARLGIERVRWQLPARRARELRTMLRDFALRGTMPAVAVVPEITEAGYGFAGSHAVLAAHWLVRLDHPRG
jgi:hypothetical protein